MELREQCRRHIDFISYDWNADAAWTSFQQQNISSVRSQRQIEDIKKEFYWMNVDSKFNTNFRVKSTRQR